MPVHIGEITSDVAAIEDEVKVETPREGERLMARSKKSFVDPETTRSTTGLTGPVPVDDLTVIKGIGSKRARVLNEAGISDFKAVAKASKKRLKELFPRVKGAKLKRWKKRAKRIAKDQRRQKPAPAPTDDLTAVKGIGPVRARVLNEAGVSDFRAFSRTSKPRLRKLFPRLKDADLTRWKEEARYLIHEGDIIV